MASQQNITLQARGLYTFPNALSSVPDGALSATNNVVIDRDGIINPRRGIKLYGSTFGTGSSRTKQLLIYKNRILRHWSTTLDVDSDGVGTFTVMNDANNIPIVVNEVSTGTRIKFLEANGNLYFTTSRGIFKVSCLNVADLSTRPVTPAGGIKALDGFAELNPNTGWFTQDSIVAYRIVWGIKDDNTNVILGTPSERIIIANSLLSLLISDYNKLVSDLATAAAADPADSLSDTDYATLKISLNDSAVVLYNALKSLANGAGNKLDNDLGGGTFAAITLTPATPPDTPATTGELVQIQEYFDNIVNALNVHAGISTTAKASIGGSFSNSTQSATVNLTFTIPEDVTTAHFYQVYRSALFTSSGASTLTDVSPDDELRLIFEDNPTTVQLVAKSITFIDDVPEAFRDGGANLYTNANSGEGIAQANEPPPLALDIALFKGSTFYANTSTRYKRQIGLLTAVGLSGGKFYIAQGSTINHYTFVNSTRQITDITCITGANFVSVGTSDYFDIYSANDESHYRVWFQSGTSVAPSGTGVTLVEIIITGAETSTQVAVKVATALTNLIDFTATNSANIVTVTNEKTGFTSSPTENVANAGFNISVTTSGSGEQAATQKVGVSSAPTPAQEVDETARSLVRVINKNNSEVVNAYYISGPNDIPGLILLEARKLGDPKFYVAANNNTISQKFNPDLKSYTSITAIATGNPVIITSAGHGLVTGDEVLIVATDSTPAVDGIFIVTFVDVNNFSIDALVTVAGTTGNWIKTSDAISADNEVVPNRIYFSKFQQPEAVPLVNFQDVGAKNKKILRILPLRDSLFILTEGGVYRLSGDGTFNFQITLFDSSTQIKAVDSAVVLNNQIYMFSSQGIATISDTGISIISRPIENKLLPLVTSLYPTFSTATNAVSYESDRAYILFTVNQTSDTVATIAYRFNTFTNTWVSWDVSKTCAVINPAQDLLYFGSGDTNSIEVERKNFTRLDYADREFTHTVPVSGASDNQLSLGSIFEATVGDVLLQTQYLTIAQVNRLLLFMDTDSGLSDNNYYTILNVSAGAKLRDTLTNLATKIDTDPGIASPGYAAAISGFTDSFVETQAAFNTIINMLNADANTKHKNYSVSNNTVEYEVPIIGTNNTTKTITMGYNAPIIAGNIMIFKKIVSSFTWVLHHFGDASLLKHVSESTILFETMNFSTAVVSYSSDLSTGFESITLPGEGTGIWGGFNWGQVVWGGDGTARPFRTFIPVNKQRCRFINGKIDHKATFENYAVYGISFTFSPISSRAYR